MGLVGATRTGLALLVLVAGAASATFTATSAGMVLLSSEGDAWVPVPVGADVHGVSSDGMAVGDGVVLRTSDGLSWSATSVHGAWRAVATMPGGWVAVGDGAVLTSPDGTSWATQWSGNASLRDVAAGPAGLVAVGDGVLFSPDGITWAVKLATPLSSVAAHADGFVAVGADGAIVTSADGLNWTAQASGTSAELRGVAAGPVLVAVGPGIVLTSADGASWTSQAVAAELRSVAYHPYGGFVAVGNGSILASADGTTWTARPAMGDLSRVVASDLPWPSPLRSTIEGAPVAVGDTTVLTVRLRDAAGIPLPFGGHPVDIAAAAGSLGTVIDRGDGTYVASYTAPTSPSIVPIAAHVDGLPFAASITVDAGPPAPAGTVISAPPSLAGGLPGTITVALHDAYGNPVGRGGDPLTLATDLGLLSAVTDLGDGRYEATLSSTAVGQARVTAFLGSQAAASATVAFVPGPADAAASVLTAPATVTWADEALLTVRVHDANGHLVGGGHDVSLITDVGTVGPVEDHGDGTYTAMLAAPAPGTSTVTAKLDDRMIGTTTIVFVPGSAFTYIIDGQTVTFQGPSGTWSFGDGTTASGPGPVHTYATGGLRTVRLEVTANGVTGTTVQTVSIPIAMGPVDPYAAGGTYVAPTDPTPPAPTDAAPSVDAHDHRTSDPEGPEANHPPIAAATAPPQTTTSALVYLDGTTSRDPDGDALRHAWLQTDGPAVTLHDAGLSRAWFVAPLGSVTFRLHVSDGALEDTTDVTVVALSVAGPAPERARPQEAPAAVGALASGHSYLAGAMLVAAAGLVASLLARLWDRRLAALALFSRVRREKLLEQPVRRAIHDLVAAEPGIHLNAIRRRLGLGRGQASHHTQLLEGAGAIRRERLGGYDCYFVPGDEAWQAREALRALKSDVAAELMRHVRQKDASTEEIARATGCSPGLVRYHATRLQEAGLLEMQRQGRSLVFSATAQGRLAG